MIEFLIHAGKFSLALAAIIFALWVWWQLAPSLNPLSPLFDVVRDWRKLRALDREKLRLQKRAEPDKGID